MFQEQKLENFFANSVGQRSHKPKRREKLNDTYLGGKETRGEKGKKEIKNDTSIGGSGKEKNRKNENKK
jgi:hypothetical protein